MQVEKVGQKSRHPRTRKVWPRTGTTGNIMGVLAVCRAQHGLWQEDTEESINGAYGVSSMLCI